MDKQTNSVVKVEIYLQNLEIDTHITWEAVAQRCSCKKHVLRNFAKFTGKHLCQSIFLNEFAGVRPATLLK